MALDQNDIRQIQGMIVKSQNKSLTYPNKKLGDTPVDNKQLTPKGYVSSFVGGQFTSVLSSISGGFTFTGNLIVQGSESVAGTLDVGPINSTSNLQVAGNASIAGSLKVAGNASIAGILYTDNIINGGSFLLRGHSVPDTYTGRVQASGTVGSPFPSTWTSSLISGGLYTITHNFGTVLYGIVTTGEGAATNINTRQSNSFDISTRTPDASSTVSAAFEFVVIKP